MHDNFMNAYHVNAHDLTIFTALFYDGSPDIQRRSWIGIMILTSISVYAVTLYIVLGWKIMMKLASNTSGSKTTHKMQKQLFKALIVQAFIPVVISFSPCMAAWYGPVLGLDFGMWNNYLGVIGLSSFPVLDPLAIIILLPNYRRKLFGMLYLPVRKLSSVSTIRPTKDNSLVTGTGTQTQTH